MLFSAKCNPLRRPKLSLASPAWRALHRGHDKQKTPLSKGAFSLQEWGFADKTSRRTRRDSSSHEYVLRQGCCQAAGRAFRLTSEQVASRRVASTHERPILPAINRAARILAALFIESLGMCVRGSVVSPRQAVHNCISNPAPARSRPFLFHRGKSVPTLGSALRPPPARLPQLPPAGKAQNRRHWAPWSDLDSTVEMSDSQVRIF